MASVADQAYALALMRMLSYWCSDSVRLTEKTMSTLKCFLMLTHTAVLSAGICFNSPSFVSYTRPHGIAVSSYNFKWSSAICNVDSIVQYEVQFTESCLSSQPLTVLTGNNRTSATVVIPSCSVTDCYARVRAELTDGTFTDYSACVLINNQLTEYQRQIYHYFQDICIPIQGECPSGFASQFFINGQLTLWPRPNNEQYSTTFNSFTGAYKFCFSNLTEEVVVSEYCYNIHSIGCSLCSAQSGEVVFQTLSEIVIKFSSSSFNFITTKTPSSSYVMQTSSKSTIEVPYGGMNATKNLSLLPIYIIIGAFSTVTVSILLAVTVCVICWYHRKHDSNSVSIYDEPALPDPIYQELDLKSISEPELEMVPNDAYCHVTHKYDNNS